MIYHLRLFVDLEQCKVVGVNIQQADICLETFEIVLAFAPIVVDLLSPVM